MKKRNTRIILRLIIILLAIHYTPFSFAQSSFPGFMKKIGEMGLQYTPPEGFVEEFKYTSPFYLQASTRLLFHSTDLRLVSADSNVLIYTYVIIAKPSRKLQEMYPHLRSEKNWSNIIRAYADTTRQPVVYYDMDKLRNMGAENGGEFILKKMDRPYAGVYPLARAVFFNREGIFNSEYDVVLYYFYKEGTDITPYIMRSSQLLRFITPVQ